MPDDSEGFDLNHAANGGPKSGQQHESPLMQVDSDRMLAVLDKISQALLALAEQQKSLALTLQAVAAAVQTRLNISAKVQRDVLEMLGTKDSE